jgi:hypothetical protein
MRRFSYPDLYKIVKMQQSPGDLVSFKPSSLWIVRFTFRFFFESKLKPKQVLLKFSEAQAILNMVILLGTL